MWHTDPENPEKKDCGASIGPVDTSAGPVVSMNTLVTLYKHLQPQNKL